MLLQDNGALSRWLSAPLASKSKQEFPGEDVRDQEGRKFLIKEHTEYSPHEWSLITAEATDEPDWSDIPSQKPPASDDFHNVSSIGENSEISESALTTRLMIKEFTEYSSRERAVLFENQEAFPESSDDFAMAPGAASFCAWYGACCMQSAEIPKKRTRRVYHNRRKTAWTDYDIEPESPSSNTDGVPAVPEVVPPSQLVELLKSGVHLSRECVRDKVLTEATKFQGGVPAVLQATGPCGWPPLLVAVQRKLQPEAIRALLELGADVECKTACCGWTPLMYAAGSARKDIVGVLLAFGADVNATAPRDKWTPLCSAIQSGSMEMVQLLMGKGANLQVIRKCHPAIASTYEDM